jgi:hypothetical protein
MHGQQNIKGFWYLYDSVIIIGIVGRGNQRAEHGLLTMYRYNHHGILCIFKVFVFYRGKGFTIFEQKNLHTSGLSPPRPRSMLDISMLD